MSCITPTKRFDMWFNDRSVKTTETRAGHLGSTSRRGRSTSADWPQVHSPALARLRQMVMGVAPIAARIASPSADPVPTGEDEGAGALVPAAGGVEGGGGGQSRVGAPASMASARSTIAAAIGFPRTMNLARSRRLRRSGSAASTAASAQTAVYHGRQAASCQGLNDSGVAGHRCQRVPDLTAVQRHQSRRRPGCRWSSSASGRTTRRISAMMSSHSSRASSSPRMPYTMAAAAGAKAMPPSGGRPASDPSPTEALRQRDRLVEVAGDRRHGEQPFDGEVVRLAEERQLAPPLRVAAGGLEVARGQVHHRRHVEGVRVLPRHLDVVGPRREQLQAASDGGDGLVELAAHRG